jgi:hypothetical protein
MAVKPPMSSTRSAIMAVGRIIRTMLTMYTTTARPATMTVREPESAMATTATGTYDMLNTRTHFAGE